MKKNGLLILLSLALFTVGCSENSSTGGGSSDDGGGSVDIGGGGGSGGGSNNGGGGTTPSCLNSGTGTGTPLHEFYIVLAGHKSWIPGDYSDPLAKSVMPTIEEAGYLFRSDNSLKVKFQINPQPRPTTGEDYCFGRKTGGAADAYDYTKLRLSLALRDIKCDQPHPTDPGKCNSQFYLGERYGSFQYRPLQPININTCSSVIDLGSKRNNTAYGTIVEIYDVKSDNACQAQDGYSDYNCPSEKIVRENSCWSVTMQVETDFTKDL